MPATEDTLFLWLYGENYLKQYLYKWKDIQCPLLERPDIVTEEQEANTRQEEEEEEQGEVMEEMKTKGVVVWGLALPVNTTLY